MRGPADVARYHAEHELAAHRAGLSHKSDSQMEATEKFLHPEDLVIDGDDELMAKVCARIITEQHVSKVSLACYSEQTLLSISTNTDHCGGD